MKQISRWERELSLRANPEERQDIWIQSDFALLFAARGAEVTMNPFGKSGPDLHARILESDLYIEATRRRANQQEQESLRQALGDGLLVQYGNPDPDGQPLLSIIQAKSKQGVSLPEGAAYVVAIKSDSPIEEIDFHLLEDALPPDISGVLFTAGLNISAGSNIISAQTQLRRIEES